MIYIKDEMVGQVKAELDKMSNPVKLIFFTQKMECQFCRETRTLLEELVSLSGKLTLEVHDFVLDKEKVEKYKIDKIPALVVEGQKDYGIRFYGIPAGYEFTSLVEACLMASAGESGLQPESKIALKQLTKPVQIKVFVTLTCPYCPVAVQLAHQLAVESELVTAEMIEAAEFPPLAAKYGVMAVPKTIINETLVIESALPEKELIERIISSQTSSQL
jgi:glutaredoxin-like protein